jgi:phosphatidate cytidylyltransferase
MKNRVITALIILVILIPLIYVNSLAFYFMAIALVSIATHEMLHVKIKKKYSKVSQFIIYVVNLGVLSLINFYGSNYELTTYYLGFLLIIYTILIILDKNIDFNEFAYFTAISIYLIVASTSAIHLRNLEHGSMIILYIIITTAASDTGAFFVGSAMGKHLLSPRLSPKKSWEGLLGGIVLATLVGTLFGILININISSLPLIIMMSFLIGLFAAVGDLFFSAIKRANDIKDFSNILPGHGGILDRIDSHLTNFIVYYLIFYTYLIIENLLK